MRRLPSEAVYVPLPLHPTTRQWSGRARGAGLSLSLSLSHGKRACAHEHVGVFMAGAGGSGSWSWFRERVECLAPKGLSASRLWRN